MKMGREQDTVAGGSCPIRRVFFARVRSPLTRVGGALVAHSERSNNLIHVVFESHPKRAVTMISAIR